MYGLIISIPSHPLFIFSVSFFIFTANEIVKLGDVMNRSFSIKNTLQIVSVTLIGVILSVVFKIDLFWGFFPGFLFLIGICLAKGYEIKDLGKYAIKGFLKTKEVMIILLLVGLLLPSWQMAGTIDGMVSLILSYIRIDYFYISAFISTLVVSMILGTSVGSLSAIGIPIMGAALGVGMSVEITAGALVSGAFVGDRTSPFSSANHLLSNTLEVERKIFQRILWRTGLIGIGVSIVYFIFLDKKEKLGITVYSPYEMEKSLIFMFPVLILLLLALCKLNIKTCFLASISTAIIISIADQTVPFEILTLWTGTSDSGGGLKKMIPLVAFIGLAGAYNGIIESLKIFQNVLTKWLGQTKNLFTMSWKTMIATMVISLLACNQTLPIILTGRTFLPDWMQNQSKAEFSRVMADSSIVFAGMIPWSVLAIMCSTVLGVPLFHYLPFAIYLWCLPIVTLLYSYVLVKIKQNHFNIEVKSMK
jgi:NhaC family Na+:H+ antiporter